MIILIKITLILVPIESDLKTIGMKTIHRKINLSEHSHKQGPFLIPTLKIEETQKVTCHNRICRLRYAHIVCIRLRRHRYSKTITAGRSVRCGKCKRDGNGTFLHEAFVCRRWGWTYVARFLARNFFGTPLKTMWQKHPRSAYCVWQWTMW